MILILYKTVNEIKFGGSCVRPFLGTVVRLRNDIRFIELSNSVVFDASEVLLLEMSSVSKISRQIFLL